MCVGSPIAGTWSSSQWRPDDEFETDRNEMRKPPKVDVERHQWIEIEKNPMP